jgi:hypothetical protein
MMKSRIKDHELCVCEYGLWLSLLFAHSQLTKTFYNTEIMNIL